MPRSDGFSSRRAVCGFDPRLLSLVSRSCFEGAVGWPPSSDLLHRYPRRISGHEQDEWALIQQLGQRSRLVRWPIPTSGSTSSGADPRRVGEFLEAFQAKHFDFVGENHRSSGTDITTYGNDLLTGANKRARPISRSRSRVAAACMAGACFSTKAAGNTRL